MMDKEKLIENIKITQERMLTQDHSWHLTKNPLYMVYRKYTVVTTEDYSSDYTYYDHDNSEVIGSDKESLIKAIKESGIDCPLDLETDSEDAICEWAEANMTIWKHFVEEVDVFEAVFFTEQGAKDYIERHKHHNSTLHMYVESGWKNSY